MQQVSVAFSQPSSLKLTIPAISRMDDQQVYDLFSELRWMCNGGVPFCSRCGGDKNYRLRGRNMWRCASCKFDYTVTNGTIFTGGKLPLRTYLFAVSIFTGAAKGISALQMSRDLGVQYKTAFTLCHKIREAISLVVDQLVLKGMVEVDGAQFGGYRRFFNVASNTFGKRICSKRMAHRRIVVVAKERDGRTIPFVVKTENDARDSIVARIEEDTVICVDESRAWDGLCQLVDSIRVNHNEVYVDGEASTNLAESFHSGMRRMHSTHGRMSADHLPAYANELAWKRDFNKMKHSDRVMSLLSLCLCSPTSSKWKGYWQRRKSKDVSRAMVDA